eukprot:2260335-Pleurochrysis_carterae.AAC.2
MLCYVPSGRRVDERRAKRRSRYKLFWCTINMGYSICPYATARRCQIHAYGYIMDTHDYQGEHVRNSEPTMIDVYVGPHVGNDPFSRMVDHPMEYTKIGQNRPFP